MVVKETSIFSSYIMISDSWTAPRSPGRLLYIRVLCLKMMPVYESMRKNKRFVAAHPSSSKSAMLLLLYLLEGELCCWSLRCYREHAACRIQRVDPLLLMQVALFFHDNMQGNNKLKGFHCSFYLWHCKYVWILCVGFTLWTWEMTQWINTHWIQSKSLLHSPVNRILMQNLQSLCAVWVVLGFNSVTSSARLLIHN